MQGYAASEAFEKKQSGMMAILVGKPGLLA
jgi:hypothetical protein